MLGFDDVAHIVHDDVHNDALDDLVDDQWRIGGTMGGGRQKVRYVMAPFVKS